MPTFGPPPPSPPTSETLSPHYSPSLQGGVCTKMCSRTLLKTTYSSRWTLKTARKIFRSISKIFCYPNYRKKFNCFQTLKIFLLPNWFHGVMLSRTGCRPGSLAEEVLAAQFSGLRPQGGVQVAGGWGGWWVDIDTPSSSSWCPWSPPPSSPLASFR